MKTFKESFPRTEVEGISMSRLLMGSNWMLGYSHTGAAMDQLIKRRYAEKESFKRILSAYMENGVDAIMAPFSDSELMVAAIKETEDEFGHGITMIDTPIINVDDTLEGHKEAEAKIKACADRGSKICLIHHSSAEQLVNKNKQQIVRLNEYTDMIREHGMVPGLSAHMPELVVYSDLNNYDVQTYIQIYNCMGFLMQVEVETVANIINHAKKPVMTIKSMAAGRCTPYVGLNFSWNTIRDCDMVTLGAFTPEEVYEDVEISLAAIERRYPDIEKRHSPNQEQAAFGK